MVEELAFDWSLTHSTVRKARFSSLGRTGERVAVLGCNSQAAKKFYPLCALSALRIDNVRYEHFEALQLMKRGIGVRNRAPSL